MNLQVIAQRVQAGETVTFRPVGTSMVPLVRSGQEVTVAPVNAGSVTIDDIVLVRVAGSTYLHKVLAVADGRVRIGNNRGGVNGWTSLARVFGICVDVDGAPRPQLAGKVAAAPADA